MARGSGGKADRSLGPAAPDAGNHQHLVAAVTFGARPLSSAPAKVIESPPPHASHWTTSSAHDS
jgi:hypothetical protein